MKNGPESTGANSFDQQKRAWASKKEAQASSVFAGILLPLYRLRLLRRICLRLIISLEGGRFFSTTLRVILRQYHGVAVGQYSYGSCLVPGVLPPGTIVGNYCSFAVGLKVLRRNHPLNCLSQHPFFYNHELGVLETDTIHSIRGNPLIVGHDVWIGDGVTILPSCRSVGDGAVIGAGAVVSKDVDPYAIVAGNPAKLIRKRFDEETQRIIGQSKWWNLSLAELLRADALLVSGVTPDRLAAFTDSIRQSHD
jgi:virginiamycin A acetyltransferase